MPYHPRIIEQLARHGLRPRADTSPAQLRDALRELYKYEIRRLRAALLAGEFPRKEYAGRVLALRERYWLLSVPTELWLVEANGGPDR